MAAAAAHAQPVPADTTIAGKSYTLWPVEVLLDRLHQRDSAPITYQNAAFHGRLFAPSALDTVYARLDFTDVRFLDEVSLNKVVFNAAVDWREVLFENGLSLQHSHFRGPADFSGSQIKKHATLRQAHFYADVNFSDCHFAAVSSFIEAVFGGKDQAFSRVAFTQAAYFERADFGGTADFRDAAFGDIASFKETTWRQEATFAGARFAGRALFWDARFAAKATFSRARADGEVAFNRATFSGPASFDHFTFAQRALFVQTAFKEAASFPNAYFRKAAEFTDGLFNGALRLQAFFNQSLDLRRVRAHTLDLQLPDGADSTFATGARFYLQQADCGQILFRWRQLPTHLAAADSASLDDLEPVYATLRRHLESRGLQRDADACHVAWMERRLKRFGWTEPAFYGQYILGLTTGYGTAPGRLAATATCIVLLCGLLYRVGRVSFAAQPNGSSPSWSACMLFSLLTFIRYNVSSLRPTGPLFLLACLEALLGWIGLALLAALLFTRFS